MWEGLPNIIERDGGMEREPLERWGSMWYRSKEEEKADRMIPHTTESGNESDRGETRKWYKSKTNQNIQHLNVERHIETMSIMF